MKPRRGLARGVQVGPEGCSEHPSFAPVEHRATGESEAAQHAEQNDMRKVSVG